MCALCMYVGNLPSLGVGVGVGVCFCILITKLCLHALFDLT